MKTLLLIIAFLSLRTCFAQTDNSSASGSSTIRLICVNKVKECDYPNSHVLLVNKEVVRDTAVIAKFMAYGLANRDAITRIKIFNTKKAKKKFDIDAPCGLIRIWSTVELDEAISAL